MRIAPRSSCKNRRYCGSIDLAKPSERSGLGEMEGGRTEGGRQTEERGKRRRGGEMKWNGIDNEVVLGLMVEWESLGRLVVRRWL